MSHDRDTARTDRRRPYVRPRCEAVRLSTARTTLAWEYGDTNCSSHLHDTGVSECGGMYFH